MEAVYRVYRHAHYTWPCVLSDCVSPMLGRTVNIVFVLCGYLLRQNYFRDSWNVFDFITVVGSVVDVIVTERDVRVHPAIVDYYSQSCHTVCSVAITAAFSLQLPVQFVCPFGVQLHPLFYICICADIPCSCTGALVAVW